MAQYTDPACCSLVHKYSGATVLHGGTIGIAEVTMNQGEHDRMSAVPCSVDNLVFSYQNPCNHRSTPTNKEIMIFIHALFNIFA